MSATLDRYLAHLHDSPQDRAAERVPEVIVISAPEDDLEALALQRLQGVSGEAGELLNTLEAGLHLGWGFNQDDEPVFNGRKCCAIVIDELARKGPVNLQIPSEHQCPDCKTLYRIQWPTLEM